MNDEIKILIVEDLPTDAELCRREVLKVLPRSIFQRVETPEDFLAALESFAPDIILSDYSMPRFDGMTALKLTQEHTPDTPFLILTGSTNEETAVACMKAGAWDYVIKEHFRRLGPAVLAALEQKEIRRERRASMEALRESEARYRAIVESQDDAICRWLPDTTLTFANTRYLELFGLTPADIGRRKWVDFLPEADREDIVAFYRKLLQEPRKTSYEHEVRLHDDSGRIFFWIDSPIFDEHGNFVEFQSVGRDVTESRLAEQRLRDLTERLRLALKGTVSAISMAVEIRDPYTAGHQRRTADLARAIAAEMGQPENIVQGVAAATAIHDIGKLAIPAEILSKPTRLTELEFSLIKNHSEQGYLMLKDIDFPWPVAEIVYQHHERCDGSGYPRGLKGDEILVEAKIIAVADVVEAMSSHRPYRASLGLETALAEIQKLRGVLYEEAVDACLRLFREKGYELKK